MMETFTVPGAADGVQLSTLIIAPGSPKAVLQLVHGMAEHKERYIPFMNYLSEMGYACVICDLRGHGKTVTDPKDLGWMGKGGMTALVDDVHCVTEWAKAQYPGLPFFLFGHSMGSMIVRSYLKRYDRDIDGLVVCGSPSNNPAAGLGDFLAGCISIFRGPRYRSQFLANLCTGNNDKKFKADGIQNAWLSTNRANVEAYNADPLCGFVFIQQRSPVRIRLHRQWLPERPLPPDEGYLLPRGMERDETGPAGPLHRRRRRSLHHQPEEILAGREFPPHSRLSGCHKPGLSQDAPRNPERNRPRRRLARCP